MALGAFAAMPGAAWAADQAPPAADAAASDVGSGNDIVVTARRRAENLQSVPIAVTAISGEALQRSSVRDMFDLQRVVPSLQVSTGYRKEAPIFQIRGQRTNDMRATQDGPVAVYFNDVVVTPWYGQNLSFYDLSSVQVLKGPQGTLFGRNTTGGAVLASPVKPGNKLEGYATASYGRFDRWSVEGAVTVPASDLLSVRVSGKITRQGPMGHVLAGPIAGYGLGTEKSENVRVSAVLRPTSDIENYTVFYYDKFYSHRNALQTIAMAGNALLYNGGAPFGLPDAVTDVANLKNAGRYDSYQSDPTYVRTRAVGVNNTTTFNVGKSSLGEITLKNILGYRNLSTQAENDLDGTRALIIESTTDVAVKQYTEEFQVLGSSPAAEWAVGFNFYQLKGYDNSIVTALKGLNPTVPATTSFDVNNKSYSVYAQSTFHLGPLLSESLEKFSLTLGFRESWDNRFANFHPYNFYGLPTQVCKLPAALVDTPGVCAHAVSASFSAPTYVATLDYKPVPGILLYVTQRRGYRSGGFNSGASDNPAQFVPFKPEFVSDTEVGIKADTHPGGMFLRTNLAVYHSGYKDIQRQKQSKIGGFQPVSVIQNAASASITGLEFESLFQPTPNLELSGFWNHVAAHYNNYDARVYDSSTGALVAGTRDYTKNKFAFLPRNTISGTVRYTIPLGETVGDLALQGNYVWQSSMWSDEQIQPFAVPAYAANLTAPNFIPSYGLANFRVELSKIAGKNLTAAAYVKNAFDKKYAVGAIAIIESLGIEPIFWGDPRTWGLDLTYRF
jgi:iron complex outermembrane receptor protein